MGRVFLFPAFTLKYKGNELLFLKQNGIDTDKELHLLSDLCQIDLSCFDTERCSFLETPLENQLLTYFFSCRYYDLTVGKIPDPSVTTGMSMGIYAALYAGGFFPFQTGAHIIKEVYNALAIHFQKDSYSMLSVIGLDENEVQQIISSKHLNCSVAVANGVHSYIISGALSDLNEFKLIALNKGAISAKLMPSTIPFHTTYVKSAENKLHALLKTDHFSNGRLPYFSPLSKSFIYEGRHAMKEIVDNITHKIYWHSLMETLIKHGYNDFVACGPGDSLKRIAAFIPGDFNMIHARQIISDCI